MSYFVTLTWLFFVSVKGAKGPIGPMGDLGTKGVEVMSPCCVVKMCVKFLYVERQFTTKKCTLCVVLITNNLVHREILEEEVLRETWELEARW